MAITRHRNRNGSTSWQVRVHVAGIGKRYVGSYPTKHAAREAEHQAKRALVMLAGGGSMTLSEFVPVWLERVQVAPTTRALYALTMKRLDPLIGHLPLSAIDKATIEGVASSLIRRYSPATVRQTVATLVGALNAATDWHYVTVRPDTRRLRMPKVSPKMRVLSHDEAHRLIEASGEMRTFVLLGLGSGLRLSELLGLDHADIDGDRVNVTRQFYRGELRPLKTDSSRRVVPVPPIVAGSIGDGDGAVFTASGRRMTASQARRRFDAACVRARLEGVTPHTMRHTYATELLAQGVDPVTAAAMMGHARVGMTLEVYAHPKEEAARRALGALSGLLGTTQGTTEGSDRR